MNYRFKTFHISGQRDTVTDWEEDAMWRWTNEEGKMLQIYQIIGHLHVDVDTSVKGRTTGVAYYDVDYHPKADLLPPQVIGASDILHPLFEDDYKLQRLIALIHLESATAGEMHFMSLPADEVLVFDPPLDFPPNEDIYGNLAMTVPAAYVLLVQAMTRFVYK